jgi:hypothetical protein
LIVCTVRFRQGQRKTSGCVTAPKVKSGSGTGNGTGLSKKPVKNFTIWGHDMSDSDGIQISDKPTWEHSTKELFVILGKRIISLPSKMVGFKPLCLYLATWLLVKGLIRDWIWFAVVVIVLFGIVGLKVLGRWKPNE